MVNKLSHHDSKSRLTLIMASSAFFITIYFNLDKIVGFYNFSTWVVSDWLLFLQLVVIAISAYIALSTIKSSRFRARERATLDTILNDNSDRELAAAKQIVLGYDKNPEKYLGLIFDEFKARYNREPCSTLSELCEFERNELKKEEMEVRQHLMHVLNRHEFYAVGVNSGLMDEMLFKRMHCNNIINLWEAVNPAVTHLRKKSQTPTYYKELELLALNWNEKPLREQDIKK